MKEVRLEPAETDHCRFFWEVNNAPDVRSASISTAPIPWEDHQRWYARALDDSHRHLQVAYSGESPIGVVRWDVTDRAATISIALHADWRGQGLGRRLIRAAARTALADPSVDRVVALTRLDNPASIRAFVGAGFGYVGLTSSDGVRLLELEFPDQKGEEGLLELYFDRLWPILRSITGEGVRQTHDILSELVPLSRHEIPTGTKVLDWVVPPEWRANQAWIETPEGDRICDIAEHNLHILNYSSPFEGTLSLDELDAHLYSLPDQPDAIPYLTTYYKRRWGFCLPHRQRESLSPGDYRVTVDTEIFDGSLTISDCVLPGQSDREVLISTYTCHPSMANNELSGPLVSAFLYQRLRKWESRRYTYRFVYLPETIGSITYLDMLGDHLREAMVAGLVVTCAGDDGPFTYKKSRRGDAEIDRIVAHVLGHAVPENHRIMDFFPNSGSDERQYCSPGFNLPVGSLLRTVYDQFPEYHTSLDNKAFISFAALRESVDMYERVLRALELNRRYENLAPYGEPNLGRRGLYPTLGGEKNIVRARSAILWVTNYSDGAHDLLDIAELSGLPLAELAEAAEKCVAAGLFERLPQ